MWFKLKQGSVIEWVKSSTSNRINDDEFKKLNNNKQSIILCLNKEDNKNINVNDKILFLNSKKKLNKKVKNLHTYCTIDEDGKNVSKKQLGFKKKGIANYNNMV